MLVVFRAYHSFSLEMHSGDQAVFESRNPTRFDEL